MKNFLCLNIHIKSESFFIEFNETHYECVPMEKNGRIIYQIKFPGSTIYLTQAKDRNGKQFWTSVPQDSKLSHIVVIIGKQIENKNHNYDVLL